MNNTTMFNSFIDICQVAFWEKNAGNCFVVDHDIKNFPAKHKYVILTIDVPKETLKKVKEEYQLDDIFCFVPKKILLQRGIRKVMYDMKLPIPYSMLRPYKYSKKAKKFIYDYCKSKGAEVIQCEYIWHADLLDFVFQDKSTTALLDTHDVQSNFTSCLKKNFGRVKNFVKEKDEIKIIKKFDYVLSVSHNDQEYFAKYLENGKHSCYLPVTTVKEGYSFFEKERHEKFSIGFLAGLSDFNLDAITWFVKNVFTKLPEPSKYVLNVYGSVCKGLDTYKADNIILHGFVKDPADIYKANDMMVNTTFQIGGIKIKCVESLYYNTPVLTTPMGARGLEGALARGGLFSFSEPNEFISFLESMDEEKLTKAREACFISMKEDFSDNMITDFYQMISDERSK